MSAPLGPILTSARSIDHLEAAARGFPLLKVVAAWGLPWTPDATRRAAHIAPTLIVRTSWGDPSAYGGQRPYPEADRILEELRPWYAARPDLIIEIGNEPVVPKHAHLDPGTYARKLEAAIRACRDVFPRARILPPAHCSDQAVSDAVIALWLQATAAAYRQCDALTIHAYSLEQKQRALHLLRTHVGAAPVWLTECNLDADLTPAARAAQIRELARGTEGACVFHLDQLGAPDSWPRYKLGDAELAALRAPAPAQEPPMRNVVAELAHYRTHVLRRGNWTIGGREGPPAVTLHWNGPAVAENRRRGEGALAQLKADLEWQTRDDWPGAKGGADGLQYHRAIDADGVIWVCRDERAKLWHCGHAEGNRESLSLHLLVGRGQEVTAAQWSSTVWQLEAWRGQYGIPLARVLGHQEWASSECPGPEVMQRLRLYRAGAPPAAPRPTLPAGLRRFTVVLPPEARATVRQGPSRAFAIAGNLKPGARILVDALLPDELGELIGGARQWAHMARVPDQQADLGFVHLSSLREEVPT